MKRLTQERVRELFDYRDGNLIRKVAQSNCVKIGDTAGSLSYGYLETGVDGGRYMVHRLIWLWHHGYLPENNIDHIDRIKSNNKIENLREASQSCNLRNCGNFKHNTSGIKGVFWDKIQEKWRSSIKVMGNNKDLGRYGDKNEAVLARLAAEQCLHWEGCDSSSPAYKYAIKNKLIRSKP